MTCRFRAFCIRAVGATLFSLSVCAQQPANQGVYRDPEMSVKAMRTLRLNAWHLLAPFAMRSEGLPLPNEWTPRHRLLPLDDGRMHSAGVAILQRAAEQALPAKGGPTLYEMTFFNDVASEYIEKNALRVRGTTEVMRARQRREIEFPRDSVAVKTFWLLMDREKLEVQKWDWKALGTRDQLPGDLLKSRCVAREAVDGCVKATDAFYTIRVADPGAFICPENANCPELKKDDLLLLVALHIASKQMPEWLWATFWWRDADAPSGTFWTCGDAQRKEALGDVKAPWSNYSMDVTASFTMKKPSPKTPADAACGVPGEIGKSEQLRAAYNPFVEAFMPHGLKSNCLDCHSRASTNRTHPANVPDVNGPVGPELQDFEGHIRLDYMWSLWHGLNGTEFPHVDWPDQP